MHGLIFETSICYWQDQPDIYPIRKSTGSFRKETSRPRISNIIPTPRLPQTRQPTKFPVSPGSTLRDWVDSERRHTHGQSNPLWSYTAQAYTSQTHPRNHPHCLSADWTFFFVQSLPSQIWTEPGFRNAYAIIVGTIMVEFLKTRWLLSSVRWDSSIRQIWLKYFLSPIFLKLSEMKHWAISNWKYMGSFFDILIFKPSQMCFKKKSGIFWPFFGYFTTHYYQDSPLIKPPLQSPQWDIRSHLSSKFQLILSQQKIWPLEIFLSPRN